MKVIGIIPARYGSSRFPGKPLADIGGKTMIQRVYEQAAQALDEVWVATDDERILNEVTSFGGCAAMTSSDCANGTQRCAELAWQFDMEDDDVIINIQGDQPFIDTEYIRILKHFMERSTGYIATLVSAHSMTKEDEENPNCVKAYVDRNGFARDFDRFCYGAGYAAYKHIGTYAYRYDTLCRLASLEYSDECGSLEQTAWLAHYQIYCIAVVDAVVSIDTPDDLIKAILRHNG